MRKPYVLHSLSACAGCGCSGDDFPSANVEAFEVTGELYCDDCADEASADVDEARTENSFFNREELFLAEQGANASTPTTCIETIGGAPETALRLSFQIKVF